MTDLVQKLVGALEWTIRELDRNTCTHEETHRGGAIWTICDGCGMKWADDRGGFKPYKEPAQLKAARAALSEAKAGGWAAVPVEPTPEMIDYVRWKEYGESSIRLSPVDDETVRSVWDSVVEASRLPAPPAQKDPT